MKHVTLSEVGESYQVKFKIDLVNNKKEALLVNGLAFLTMILMGIPFIKTIYQIGYRLGSGESPVSFLLNAAFVVVGSFLYIVGHEAVHGLVMKLFTDAKLRFGYRFVYAYAGSLEGMFRPTEYMLIALAPLVVWGIIFEVGRAIFPFFAESFYLLQILNVSGAMGDVYVFFRILKHAKEDLLINDTGTDMQVFERR